MEMLVVILIIAVMATLFLPMLGVFTEGSEAIATAGDFRTFGNAFRSYMMLEGEWPPDTIEEVPAGVGMEVYLSPESFEREAPIGGRYNWDGPENHPYAGIALTTTPASIEQLEIVDDKLDDGNLNTGFFRRTPNGRYTYILEDDL